MKNSDRMIRDRKIIEATISRLTDGVMLDLCRRAGTRAIADSVERGPRGKGTHSDPTAAAVIRKESARLADPVFDSVRDISRLLDEMARCSQKLQDLVRFVQTGKEQAKAQTTANCKECDRLVYCTPADRLRSGLCQACYQAQRRAKAQ